MQSPQLNSKPKKVARKYRATRSGELLLISSHIPLESKQRAYTKRAAVKGFSEASKRRLVKYTREINKDRFQSFITLTYPNAPEPKEAKAHLDRIIQEIRRYVEQSAPRRLSVSRQTRGDANDAQSKTPRAARTVPRLSVSSRRYSRANETKNKSKRNGGETAAAVKVLKTPFSILWVMEFQKRGAIHYHIWCSHFVPKQKLRRAWNKIIGEKTDTPSTDIRRWKVYTKSGLSSYVRKYAAKQIQKELPEELKETGAGRWWGVCGDVSRPNFITADVTPSETDKTLLKKLVQIAENSKEIECPYVELFKLSTEKQTEIHELLAAIERERLEQMRRKLRLKNRGKTKTRVMLFKRKLNARNPLQRWIHRLKVMFAKCIMFIFE